ncbi:MAG TPA: CRTAC1 family protein [Planctomycetaceae bacterium]|nr:CRTAC1 family protein [Planctomycetaceae bacterium]
MKRFASRRSATIGAGLVVALGLSIPWLRSFTSPAVPNSSGAAAPEREPAIVYAPRRFVDIGGFTVRKSFVSGWRSDASLQEVARAWSDAGSHVAERIDAELRRPGITTVDRLNALLAQATMLNYNGEPRRAYELLSQIRSQLGPNTELAADWTSTMMFLQGVTALRLAEDENCILCRGESSCILPIAPAAVHVNPEGSRLAIARFMEYLAHFPEDLEVRWLLNLAHMTLGEHPDQVDPRYVISLEGFTNSGADIGRFRDVGHLAGVNRLNQAGGAIMDDFDNDGLLDIVVTSNDPTQAMAACFNRGDGTFEDRTESAGLAGQLGGLNCVQTDFNNDGALDVFIPRGAWLQHPIRPSLLENDGHGVFTDVTHDAGLAAAVNSNAAGWADYDNDGWLDVFVCCERQPCRLYRNLGNGRFEERAASAGVDLGPESGCKGCAWIDFDNDGYPDLYVTCLHGPARLFQNRRDGTFSDVTRTMGVDGPPRLGFSCWAWDYDNDGWLDIFATCYERTAPDLIKGLLGLPHGRNSNRLFRNREGRGFEDRTRDAGLDIVFGAMGSNYADLNNDGYLDLYLGTGDPFLETLVPNRMFLNTGSGRFVEITGSSGTGHLQKGHGVACGDWDRDGDVDLFVQMGGVTNGDKYHNVLFENPGQDGRWLTLKLHGERTNRPGIGVRIKIVTSGEHPLTIHRHISSGSSFGANPLTPTIGLGRADRIARLEIHWPTSASTQVFHDVAVNQAIQVREFAEDYQVLDWRPCDHAVKYTPLDSNQQPSVP